MGVVTYYGGDACATGSSNLNQNGLLGNRLCGTTWTSFARGNSYQLLDPQNIKNLRYAVSAAVATNTELFVSDYCNNKIKVYDAESMLFLREFSVLKLGKLTLDKQGNILVL